MVHGIAGWVIATPTLPAKGFSGGLYKRPDRLLVFAQMVHVVNH
jgi:hypothetical protein